MIRVKGSGSRRGITYKSRSFLPDEREKLFYALYCKILLFVKIFNFYIFQLNESSTPQKSSSWDGKIDIKVPLHPISSSLTDKLNAFGILACPISFLAATQILILHWQICRDRSIKICLLAKYPKSDMILFI
jgi:hypothetical protein